MNRQEKEVCIKELENDALQSQSLFLINYKGLTVAQMQLLRKDLRANGGRLKVAKMRLLKRAIQDADRAEVLKPYMKNQVALVYSQNEAPVIAKVLYNFAKGNEQVDLVAGYFESELLTGSAISRLAKLPSRDVLYAQLCIALSGPIAKLARVLNQPLMKLVSVLSQVKEQKQ